MRLRPSVLLASAAICVGVFLGQAAMRARAKWGHRFSNPPRGAIVDDFSRLLRPSPHPDIGLALRPDLDVRFKGRPFRTNGAGWRDRPRSTRKPPGAFRIVGIGDSVMMGWGTGQEESYLAQLEKLLAGRGVEALNFAVGGYNTEQEFAVLRDIALAYQPDLILIGYVGNDLEPASYGPARRFSPPQSFHAAMVMIAYEARRRGVPAVVMLDSRYESARLSHEGVCRLARSLGMECLNLLARYRRLPPGVGVLDAVNRDDEHNRRLILPGDGHPNEAWHRRTARVLADFLEKRGLLPDDPIR